MHIPPAITVTAALLLILHGGCAKNQTPSTPLIKRPLEATRAAAIIENVLTERGYKWKTGETVRVSNFTSFEAD